MAKRSVLERAQGKYLIDESGCWLWIAARNRDGYGIFDGCYAHRVLYKQLVGPVADHLHLDHLCRVRHCVNPTHLEPVTARINVMRSAGFAPINAAKHECKNGHPFDEANTYRRAYGSRSCRACHAKIERERRARLKG